MKLDDAISHLNELKDGHKENVSSLTVAALITVLEAVKKDQEDSKSVTLYAIGDKNNTGDYDMWHGPTPSLSEMLEEEGCSDHSYIIQMNPDVGHTQYELYRWSCGSNKWVMLK